MKHIFFMKNTEINRDYFIRFKLGIPSTKIELFAYVKQFGVLEIFHTYTKKCIYLIFIEIC